MLLILDGSRQLKTPMPKVVHSIRASDLLDDVEVSCHSRFCFKHQDRNFNNSAFEKAVISTQEASVKMAGYSTAALEPPDEANLCQEKEEGRR